MLYMVIRHQWNVNKGMSQLILSLCLSQEKCSALNFLLVLTITKWTPFTFGKNSPQVFLQLYKHLAFPFPHSLKATNKQ